VVNLTLFVLGLVTALAEKGSLNLSRLRGLNAYDPSPVHFTNRIFVGGISHSEPHPWRLLFLGFSATIFLFSFGRVKPFEAYIVLSSID
jgi:hypothetical protein